MHFFVPDEPAAATLEAIGCGVSRCHDPEASREPDAHRDVADGVAADVRGAIPPGGAATVRRYGLAGQGFALVASDIC